MPSASSSALFLHLAERCRYAFEKYFEYSEIISLLAQWGSMRLQRIIRCSGLI
ncbi:hypothetical protein BDZ91DRAFT_713993 [Kalaharituber pfeilii]|nr:hypothetical protein BDZ91DRAFT_713993 [Kalaharituber pfeilii]